MKRWPWFLRSGDRFPSFGIGLLEGGGFYVTVTVLVWFMERYSLEWGCARRGWWRLSFGFTTGRGLQFASWWWLP